MRCPFCKETNQDKVIDSRLSEGGDVIRRRRMCMKCKKRFTTKERAENEIRVTVIKRDGTRVPYDRLKIMRGLQRACWKRPVEDALLEQVVDKVEDTIFRNNEREVSSQYVGLLIGDYLREIDQIAYVRFASVYRHFEDLGELINEAQDVIHRHASQAPGQQKLFD
jgi:transcriptional repressor NrdR